MNAPTHIYLLPLWRLLLLLGVALHLTGCGKPPDPVAEDYLPTKKIKVVTTSLQLAELANQIGGTAVNVECLVPSKATSEPKPTAPEDAESLPLPEEWHPTPFKINLRASELFTMQTAHLVIVNGLGLEAKLESELAKIRKLGVTVVVVGDTIPAEERLTLADGSLDPCYWNSPRLWKYAIAAVTAGLQKLVRPEAADFFEYRSHPVMERMNRLITWTNDKLNASKPKGQRFILTSHNSLGYFAKDFGIEARSLWQASDGTPLVQDEAELIAWLEKQRISDLVLDASTPKDLAMDDLAVKYGVFPTKPVYTIYPAKPGTKQLGKMESFDVGTYEGAFQQLIRVLENRLGGSRSKPVEINLPEPEPAPTLPPSDPPATKPS